MLDCLRHKVLVCCLAGATLVAGCAGPKSLIVLLPENGKVSGEVSVTTAEGTQLLTRSWEAAEIPADGEEPAPPVVLDETAVRGTFGRTLAAKPLPAAHYTLYFQLNSAELLPDSERLAAEIVTAVNERQPAELVVVGHTDTMGSIEYNYQLGLLRATAVADLLKTLGAAPAIVDTSSRGKTELSVSTADQILEPRNRRAEVSVR
jgi:outer membrane protein OmpA-like peptidoglycan-associated protein